MSTTILFLKFVSTWLAIIGLALLMCQHMNSTLLIDSLSHQIVYTYMRIHAVIQRIYCCIHYMALNQNSALQDVDFLCCTVNNYNDVLVIYHC